jgi:uncharacterized protein (DUF488 family)
MAEPLLTVGHSNHTIEHFLGLLQRHAVTVACDVRSDPFSRYTPHFSRDPLRQSLRDAGISYLFLGKELGARSENRACYRQGKVQFDLLAREPVFLEGLARLLEGVRRHTVALVCAEKDPLDCHRAILVARKVHEAGLPVAHILADGELESHADLEKRLLKHLHIPPGDLFRKPQECLDEAYEIQGARIAYQDANMAETEERYR